MHKKLTTLWFALGLGSQLQILASLSITESILLFSAPFLIFNELGHMRRNGVAVYFYLSLLLVFGCMLACIVNQTYSVFVLRGMAVCCIISCTIVFSHWIIRHDPSGFRWFFVGSAISIVLCTFIFKRSFETTMYGYDAEGIMSGPLFWIQRIGAVVTIPIKGWYLQTPLVYSALAPLFLAAYAFFTSESGRSAALASLGFVLLVFFGGNKRRTMMRVSRHFFIFIITAAALVACAYAIYTSAALSGRLNEKALAKYEKQTHGEKGIVRLLLGGRADSIVGLLACLDKPLIGWGPWAEDEGGRYMGEFLSKYGAPEDYALFIERERAGHFHQYRVLLSCHSHITEFWLWYGASGLIFILYSTFILIRFLRQDVYVVPQWYGWLACAIPGVMWHIFFSAFADRVGFPLMVVACLMSRAVRKGYFILPPEMLDEIERNEQRR